MAGANDGGNSGGMDPSPRSISARRSGNIAGLMSSNEDNTSQTVTAHPSSSDSVPRELWLQVAGAGSIDRHMIPAGRVVVIGRGSKADIDLGSTSVSRRHALIYNNEAVPKIADMRSGNGTWVGEQQLDPEQSVPVPIGSEIRIGDVKLLLVPAAPDAPSTPSTGDRAPSDVVVVAPQMREVYDLAGRVAQSDISVLILGETGSGKEVLASSIHRRSPRAAKPFLCLNCGAFSESLLESEIFGHEKGAFTGAVRTKVGLLESADGGTVFLDEIGEMPPALQIKLLRVIEERKITRVGDVKPRSIDVRFLAATHRDLAEEIARGAFRQDLFFRINGISLTIPSLRERAVEIGELARHFLASAAQRAGRRPPRISPEALAVLEAHSWPGNIRELRNVMDRALVLCTGDVITAPSLQLDSVPGRKRHAPRGASSRDALPASDRGTEEERRHIIEALEQCAGNQTYAAKLLGISRGTLVSRIELYDIPRPRRPREAPQ